MPTISLTLALDLGHQKNRRLLDSSSTVVCIAAASRADELVRPDGRICQKCGCQTRACRVAWPPKLMDRSVVQKSNLSTVDTMAGTAARWFALDATGKKRCCRTLECRTLTQIDRSEPRRCCDACFQVLDPPRANWLGQREHAHRRDTISTMDSITCNTHSSLGFLLVTDVRKWVNSLANLTSCIKVQGWRH